MAWGTSWNNITVGWDKGSPEGDKAVVSLYNGSTDELTVIGESIELTIPTGPWKSKTIKAIQVGDLAIYFGDEPDIGLVIHVPTLTKFDRAIPDAPTVIGYTQEQLIGWCWKVQQDKKDLWQYMADFNNADYKEMDKDILNVTKEYCLSIGVE